jgi:hypothetical protein
MFSRAVEDVTIATHLAAVGARGLARRWSSFIQ